MRGLLGKIIAIILAGVLAPIVSISSVSAIASGGIGGRPANPDPENPRTQSIFIMTVDRGAEASDEVLVSNTTDQTQTIEMYAVDGMTTNTGAYTCRQEADARVRVGAWTRLAKNEIVLEAGKSEKVGFQVAVPPSGDVGEQNGCIVFQTPQDTSAQEGNVRIQMRQAIRLVVTVPGELHKKVEIESFNYATSGDRPTYTLKVKNVGNVSSDIDARVKVTSVFGNEVYQNGGGYPVMPDQSLELSFEDDKAPIMGGWYWMEAAVKYDKRAGVFGTDSVDNLATLQSEKKLVFIKPTSTGWLIYGAILLLALLAVGVGLAKKWQRSQAVRRGVRHHVAAGETIQTVADKYGVSWKAVARLNDIKAPYTLRAGQVLKVPRTRKK